MVGVGEEVSTILSSSRFKEEFDFQPCPTGSCSVEKIKVVTFTFFWSFFLHLGQDLISVSEIHVFIYFGRIQYKKNSPVPDFCHFRW